MGRKMTSSIILSSIIIWDINNLNVEALLVYLPFIRIILSELSFYQHCCYIRNAEPFKDRYFQPYMPVFADGWVPPEITTTPQQEAAAKSTAAMVARMQVCLFLFQDGGSCYVDVQNCIID